MLLFPIGIKAQKIFKFACDNQQPKTEREFKIWLKEDVGYIVTNKETEAFLKLQTDEERANLLKTSGSNGISLSTRKETNFVSSIAKE